MQDKPPPTTRLRAENLTAFVKIARDFAARLQPGDAVAIQGPLGAGKTTFISAIVEALHGAAEASSPTFVFWHTYEGVPTINHLDLYRIEHSAELSEMGLEEAFGPDAITFTEWPERAPELLPPSSIWVKISGAGPEAREIEFQMP